MGKYQVKIGIIGGSGLSNPDILENSKECSIETPYGKPSDVLLEGKIKGVDCVVLARHGRKHTIMPSNVNYRANIWALREVGCTHILASTATGSLQENIHPGDLVLLDSFIDRTKMRPQTFYDGAPNSPVGICHLPMKPAFCPDTRQVVLHAAKEAGINCRETGTCVAIEGPRFSSLAESNMFRSWGAHVINMTTVPEVVLAKEAGLCYVALALVTDYDCWREATESVSVTEVMSSFKKNMKNLVQVFLNAIPLIAEKDWDETLDNLKATVQSSIMLPH
ncbi:S-methyl-5'-thioadenosine phosphorylase [Anabrus simplex]|uniref:S-methyl-5'-thioadenosine phosphorylase n=1 Tax=Anabrus simplex TaxID=316456 RepID=UPI0035A35E95